MVDHGDFVVEDVRIDLVAAEPLLEDGLIVEVNLCVSCSLADQVVNIRLALIEAFKIEVGDY
jgi:hypothetical protein